jgi:hypothetical protein
MIGDLHVCSPGHAASCNVPHPWTARPSARSIASSRTDNSEIFRQKTCRNDMTPVGRRRHHSDKATLISLNPKTSQSPHVLLGGRICTLIRARGRRISSLKAIVNGNQVERTGLAKLIQRNEACRSLPGPCLNLTRAKDAAPLGTLPVYSEGASVAHLPWGAWKGASCGCQIVLGTSSPGAHRVDRAWSVSVHLVPLR